MPLYSSSPAPRFHSREYYYPRRPRRAWMQPVAYYGGDHFLDEELYDDFEYEDENIEIMDTEPQVPPIPVQHLDDPTLDDNLLRVAPRIYTPTAASNTQATTTQPDNAIASTSSANVSQAPDQNDSRMDGDNAAANVNNQNDLLNEYLIPEDGNTGPALPPRMLQLAQDYWDQGLMDFEKLQVTEAYDRLMRPQNADHLVPTLVNPEIRMNRNSPITIKDRQL